jgi:hypothetical protein
VTGLCNRDRRCLLHGTDLSFDYILVKPVFDLRNEKEKLTKRNLVIGCAANIYV